jgi:hypothetical protein
MESQQVLVEAPSAASAAGAEQAQEFTLPVLTAMVVGSMVGAGIFSLPRAYMRQDRSAPLSPGPLRRGACMRWRACFRRSPSASPTSTPGDPVDY